MRDNYENNYTKLGLYHASSWGHTYIFSLYIFTDSPCWGLTG